MLNDNLVVEPLSWKLAYETQEVVDLNSYKEYFNRGGEFSNLNIFGTYPLI